MIKEELIAYAIVNYPHNTTYRTGNNICCVNTLQRKNIYTITNQDNVDAGMGAGYFRYNGEWSEIVSRPFPEKWYIQVTKDNIDALRAWRHAQPDVDLGEENNFKVGVYVLSKHYYNTYFVTNQQGPISLLVYHNYAELTPTEYKQKILNEKDMKVKSLGFFLKEAKYREAKYRKAVGALISCEIINLNLAIFKTGSAVHSIINDAGVLHWFEEKFIEEQPKLFLPNSKYEMTIKEDKSGLTIDGNTFTREWFEAAKIISEHNKADIIVGCGAKDEIGNSDNQWKMPHETIIEVLKRLETK